MKIKTSFTKNKIPIKTTKKSIKIISLLVIFTSCDQEEAAQTPAIKSYTFESIQIEPGIFKTQRRGVHVRTILMRKDGKDILPTLNSYKVIPDGPYADRVERFTDALESEGSCNLFYSTPWLGRDGYINVTFDSIKPGDSIVVKVLDKGDCSGSEYNLYAIDSEGEKHLICSSNKSEVCTVPF